MAAETGFSHTTIRRMWAAFGLRPHRSQTFKLSSDPLFVDKVRDIVGLYLSPPTRAVVLSIDENSQIQALDREQPVLPIMRGHRNVARTAMCGMARPRCSPPSMLPPGSSSANATSVTGRPSLNFLKEIDAQVPQGSISISSWIICHPQNSQDQGVARPPTALSCPLHTDFGVMDQSGRALASLSSPGSSELQIVCEVSSYLRQATQSRYPLVHRSAQPNPGPSNGPNLPTKSWLPLSASATKHSRHYAANFKFT